ncbi:unnamed protein product [Acanthoscelides obtectus]|uniref:Uncharacterized protein n=1 Tax=Acanthoscelides obtectus TaxID=200917 RepID=A0A9P0Q8X8_ACAOB|nr:unnamed protein product [Acanthoscelides obtectus]CAK1657520.1 hypothetical protein AOBTE_LOCUS20388 [Acanthoscelides obtectus]
MGCRRTVKTKKRVLKSKNFFFAFDSRFRSQLEGCIIHILITLVAIRWLVSGIIVK